MKKALEGNFLSPLPVVLVGALVDDRRALDPRVRLPWIADADETGHTPARIEHEPQALLKLEPRARPPRLDIVVRRLVLAVERLRPRVHRLHDAGDVPRRRRPHNPSRAKGTRPGLLNLHGHVCLLRPFTFCSCSLPEMCRPVRTRRSRRHRPTATAES